MSLPLAERLRPQHLADCVGQPHLLAAGAPLQLLYSQRRLQSFILWGAAGTGKTTLARLFAQQWQTQSMQLSATLAGVKDLRDCFQRAEEALQRGQRSLLFIDEIHRFHKGQQDALLPQLESGLITLIGATTEHPSFALNRALLSRCQVFALEPLRHSDLEALLRRALALPEYAGLQWDEDAQALLFQHADGDGRRLLNDLEWLLEAARQQGLKRLDLAFVSQQISAFLLRAGRQNDDFYELISALHKSIRGSHPDAALYWLTRMLEGGIDRAYLARRLVRIAWEDIGLADPRAAQYAECAAASWERLGQAEGDLALAQATLYLACAAKSDAGYCAYLQMRDFVQRSGSPPVPLHLRNASTALQRQQGYGRHYRHAHREPHAYAAGENYMPEALPEPRFYQPSERGLEKNIAEKLAWLRQLDAQA